MDLNRLKIPENGEQRRGGALKTLILCLICLAAGFAASHFSDKLLPPDTVKVRTVVARSAGGGRARTFTAGGWVEVAVPKYPIVLSARIFERLEELNVHEGQTVKAGQVIARLFDKDARSRLALAVATENAERKTHEKLQAGYRKEEVLAAKGALAEAAEAMNIAKINYERAKKLTEFVTAEVIDARHAEFKKARAAHDTARAELDKLEAGYREEDIAVAFANLQKASAQVELARRDLSYCNITVPDVGHPLRVLRVFQKVGEYVDVRRETEIISLYDPNDMQARVDVPQSNLRNVKVGGGVIVTTEANPEVKYEGTVLRMEPLAEIAKNTVTVRIKIKKPDAMLFPEMVAQIAFLADEQPGDKPEGVLIPTAAIRGDGDNAHVFVNMNGRAQWRKVSVSDVRGDQSVVSSGLLSGQRVIIEGPEKLTEGQQVTEE